MAIAVPYKRRPDEPARYPAIDDYTPVIYKASGQWAETEVGGNRCIVKVRTTADILAILDTEYTRLPKDSLADSLADLSPAANDTLQQELENMGYVPSEITAALGNDLAANTLGEVLRFAATRRRLARWDPKTDEIVLDGTIKPCRSVDDVDIEVPDAVPIHERTR
jgi:hypothetical protein